MVAYRDGGIKGWWHQGMVAPRDGGNKEPSPLAAGWGTVPLCRARTAALRGRHLR